MNKEQKKRLIELIILLAIFVIITALNIILENGLAGIIPGFKYGWIIPLILYGIIYIIIGYEVIGEAVSNLFHGELIDEDFLMTFASLAAFGLGIYTSIKTGTPEGFDEGCGVMLLFQFGEWVEEFAEDKSRKSIEDLMDIRPDTVRLYNQDTKVETIVDPNTVKIGDVIVVLMGEKIPLDGKIIEGSTSIDSSKLTGEALPIDVGVGDQVVSGTINLSSKIYIKVEKEFSESTVSKILKLVEEAEESKSKPEAFITKFSKIYTPIVVGLAVLLAVLLPLIQLIATGNPSWTTWIYRSLSFLVVSCPCAIVVSVPLAFFSGIGAASKKGILIKGSEYIELYNKASTYVFDKTGTLTKGNFKITKIYPNDQKEEILKYAAIAEQNINHPISLSIINEYTGDIDNNYICTNVTGKGVIAKLDHTILCGNEKLLEENNIQFDKCNEYGTVVYVAVDGNYLGYILINDEIKDNAKSTIAALNKNGKTIMLTGDNASSAQHVSSELGLTSFHAKLLPQDKVFALDSIISRKQANEHICYVGDGVNDAPVLVKADVGIAMGAIGTDAAIEAADIVLMNDQLDDLIVTKKICKKTMRIVYENIIISLLIKVSILILSALGLTNMWVAIFGDVGVLILAILNATRASHVKRKR